MAPSSAMPATQRIVQVCLFVVAAIALFGGTLQLSLGQPETTPRLDNIHRFMGGIYLSMGIVSFWAAVTVRQQNDLPPGTAAFAPADQDESVRVRGEVVPADVDLDEAAGCRSAG